jgi:hypothetical protein
MTAESKSKSAANSKSNPRSRTLVLFFAGSNSMRISAHCNNNLTIRLRRYRTNDASMLGPSRGTNVQP